MEKCVCECKSSCFACDSDTYPRNPVPITIFRKRIFTAALFTEEIVVGDSRGGVIFF